MQTIDRILKLKVQSDNLMKVVDVVTPFRKGSHHEPRKMQQAPQNVEEYSSSDEMSSDLRSDENRNDTERVRIRDGSEAGTPLAPVVIPPESPARDTGNQPNT